MHLEREGQLRGFGHSGIQLFSYFVPMRSSNAAVSLELEKVTLVGSSFLALLT